MSGLKYSEIEIEMERKASQKALSGINSIRASIGGFKEKIEVILNEIPTGVKKSFSKEIQDVNDWLAKEIKKPAEGMNSSELNTIVKELMEIESQGREMLHIVIDIKEVKREKKGRELIEYLEGLVANFQGIKSLLNKWKQGEYEAITKTLTPLIKMIEEGEFVETENVLNQLDKRLVQLRKEVTALEIQDNQRHYVLSALKNVCKKMNWREIKESFLEDEDNAQSPLIYEVKSFSAGKMRFSLTLEGIEVESPFPIEDRACYEQFDEFSEKLKDFGVITKFEGKETAGGKPISKEKKAKILPKGRSRSI